MDLYLKGKTAVVTGASQGIGRAITKELAVAGVKVFATARNHDRLNSLKNEIIAAGGVAPEIFAQDSGCHRWTAKKLPKQLYQH
jgi:3-oxoacyl-[acyl-carrier protein] reductase